MRQNLAGRTRLMACLLALAGVPCLGQTPTPDSPVPNSSSNTLQANPQTNSQTNSLLSVNGKAVSASKAVMINGRPYVRPTAHEQFVYYLKDSYGWPALAGTSVRALFGQAREKPDGWGQDWPGFGQRFGSAAAVTAINGNVRYGLSAVLKEDMRYIPCHGCSVKRKIGNAFLSEITARHDSDGHRFFTITPIIADFSGPIIANTFWFPPGHGPLDGLVATRTVLATRIGGHLFREFVMERRHKDPKLEN